MIQTIHNGYDDAVSMEQRIIYANATVVFVELLSFPWRNNANKWAEREDNAHYLPMS